MYQPQWGLRTPVRRGGHGPHHELYELIHPGERVAIIGVGGGGSLQALAHPSEDIVAIEREPAVVRYFTEVAPEDNGGIFLKVQTVAGDGRNYLERQTRPFDAIVFESAKYQPAHSLLPASSPYYLYTFESIRTAVDHLADDGWISLGFAQLKPKEGMEYLPLQARQSLSSLGLHATAFNTGEDGRIVVVGSRSRETMSEIGRSALASHGLWRPDSEASSIHEIRLTDARPFAAWTTMKPKDKRSLLGTAVAIGVACVVVASALAGRARRSLARRWNPVPYFLTIGVAQATFAVATCTMWRSFWQDDVLTVVRVLVWLIAWGGAGSALASRLPIARLHPWVRIAAFVAVFAAHFALTRAVPFEEPSLLRRELAAALLLAPGGLAMGTLFPLGLSAMSPRHTGLVLLADAIGALLGYVLLYLVALPLGVPAFATSAVGAYGVAAALWRPRPAAVPPEIPTRGASDGLVGDDGPSSSIAEVS
ncbi:MAG: hypothetical protein D6798_18320 [Deltaproteobacteria bacterium]|nr:MAG: hypothetical protein D6798_18320 [Deltaproteobacteria bacterium]